MNFETRAIHAGEEPDFREGAYGDVSSPIHLSSTFARKEIENPTGGYEYSRAGNPTRTSLETKLAAIENANYGLAFASGLATATVIALTLLNEGDHVIAFDDLYGGTRRLFNEVFRKNFNIEYSFVDARNPQLVLNSIKDNTKMIWLETPTNPLLKLCDIQEISNFAKKQNLLTVVDNTFMSSYFQNPLQLGADIVMHSTTKFINGHCDSIGGAIMLNNKALYEKLKYNQNAIGAILSPFDSFLVMRGIKTLSLRMREHEKNATVIASFLENHKKVKKVNYPGLKSHPQHDLASKQMNGFGSMISFEINGTIDDIHQIMDKLKIFTLAESLGGVESLIEHPALMTHASIPETERAKVGISNTLLRISVGIEHIDDLLDDLKNALD